MDLIFLSNPVFVKFTSNNNQDKFIAAWACYAGKEMLTDLSKGKLAPKFSYMFFETFYVRSP